MPPDQGDEHRMIGRPKAPAPRGGNNREALSEELRLGLSGQGAVAEASDHLGPQSSVLSPRGSVL
jgi:hypothetical protein